MHLSTAADMHGCMPRPPQAFEIALRGIHGHASPRARPLPTFARTLVLGQKVQRVINFSVRLAGSYGDRARHTVTSAAQETSSSPTTVVVMPSHMCLAVPTRGAFGMAV